MVQIRHRIYKWTTYSPKKLFIKQKKKKQQKKKRVFQWLPVCSGVSVCSGISMNRMERTLKDLFLAILKGIPNKMCVNLAQNMHALFCTLAIYKAIVPTKIHGV